MKLLLLSALALTSLMPVFLSYGDLDESLGTQIGDFSFSKHGQSEPLILPKDVIVDQNAPNPLPQGTSFYQFTVSQKGKLKTAYRPLSDDNKSLLEQALFHDYPQNPVVDGNYVKHTHALDHHNDPLVHLVLNDLVNERKLLKQPPLYLHDVFTRLGLVYIDFDAVNQRNDAWFNS